MSVGKYYEASLLVAGFTNASGLSDLRRIICKFYYLGVVTGSSILNDKEEQLFETLLKEKNLFIGYRFSLLYRATRDGFTANDFHGRVDDKGPTITFIQTKRGNVFAGFTTIPWTSMIHFLEDNSAFLMTLRSSNEFMKLHSKRPKLFQVMDKKSSFAVYHHPNHLCSFGMDVILRCDASAKMHCCMGSNAYPKAMAHYLNDGAYNFIPVQIETFACDLSQKLNAY